MDEIPFGTTVKARATIRDEDGYLIDPATSVVMKKQAPSGTETTYTYGTDAELTRLSEGIYQLRFKPDADGRWVVRGKGVDGDTDVANEKAFTVGQSVFASP